MNASQWYASLNKPSWAPAENVFGIVWSILYPIILAVNIYVIYLLVKNRITWLVALPFWLNLFFNVIFTPIQFGLRNNSLALVDIALVLITIVWSIMAVWPHSRLAAAAFLPYLVWVSVATALQTYITFHN